MCSSAPYKVSVASGFSFYGFQQSRDMTEMAKPKVVTKDRSFAAVHPNFGFDTHRQCGRPSFHNHASRGLRGLPTRIVRPDFSRQTAADLAACACKSHREPQPFTSHGTG